MITIDGQTVDQDGRFSRFELISWWDQQRLRGAKILVIGAGALGNEIVKNCALVGMGNVLLADMDIIEHSNLSRSVLFREENNGSAKAEVACASARDIYPEMNIHGFNGNVVYGLGLGAYLWADVIIGGLDNREARVAINEGASFARKPWIDGAIEVLNGVARVFSAADGPCYECTMNDIDWKILESRRSCALLTREEMEEGKVPTTPTTASIVAGVQVQEAIKIIHGIDALYGQGMVFSGMTNEFYLVTYTRKEDCFGHETYTELVKLARGAGDITVGEILARARNDLGRDAVVELSRDIISALRCPQCDNSQDMFRPLGTVSEKDAKCPDCGEMRAAETLLTLGTGNVPEHLTLAEIGVPPFDVVTGRRDETTISYLMHGDAEQVLGKLPHE
jgi:molybdopterin/thiamine biosynthesis adenylyltransferase